MKYINIFHANLNYAYLTSDKYEFVIRAAYELLFDTMSEKFPNTRYVFEASGFTIEQMALLTPDVLSKLKKAVANGTCEFMGSPYAHPMLPNFPEEDGMWSIRFSNEVYKKYLGMTPKSFWNPECGWRSYVPKQVAENGYTNLLGDFEAYGRSLDVEGKPLRPEIYEKEYTDEPSFYSFEYRYEMTGDEYAIHFPFDQIDGYKGRPLRVFQRTDRIAQFGVRFFMGMPGYTMEQYLDLVRKYSIETKDGREGALIVFADDAEYIGTNGWFRLKYQNLPDNVFEVQENAREHLITLITEVEKIGKFITFDEACNNLPCNKQKVGYDDDTAWHGAQASTWANTPMACLLRPWQNLVREKLYAVKNELPEKVISKAWYHLTNSYNSDGQWPPTLPHAPHIIHPFNYRYCFQNLLRAEQIVGGVDRNKLGVNPQKTLKEILGPQQHLVTRKAEQWLSEGSEEEKAYAAEALFYIKQSKAASIAALEEGILYPDEYQVRADSLIEARRLVGGVHIDQTT